MTNFFAEPQKITLRDKEILVSPLAVKNLSKAAMLATPLIASFADGKVNPIAILQNTDAVIALTALATNETVDFLGELNAAELLALLELTITTNVDFFTQTITPILTGLMQSVQKSVKPQEITGTQP